MTEGTVNRMMELKVLDTAAAGFHRHTEWPGHFCRQDRSPGQGVVHLKEAVTAGGDTGEGKKA